MSVLRDNFYWRGQFFGMQVDYLKDKILFWNYYYGGVENWLATSKTNPSPKKVRPATSIPILLYHGVIDDPGWQPDEVSVRLNDFRNQMFALKKAGYQTITVEDYLKFAKREKQLPEKSFLLTFDDGRKDSYYPVDPVLRALGYNAVMNVITGRSIVADNERNSFHLSQVELKKMLGSGRWEIESHGRNDHDYMKISADGQEGHFLSNKLWLDKENRLETEEEFRSRINGDLADSKKDLEKSLDNKVLAFAYPFGDFGQATENFPESSYDIDNAIKSSYSLAFSQTGSGDFLTNYPGNFFVAKRIGVDSFISPQGLVTMLDNARDKNISYEDNLMQNNGWLKSWGSLEVGGGRMVLGNSQTEDSGLAILSGSYLWSNYSVKANVKLLKGFSFAIVSHYADENDYVACEFSDTQVALAERVGGQDKSPVEVLYEAQLSSGNPTEADMQVNGNKADCLLNGLPVVSSTTDSRLKNGGIGFKIWDSTGQGSSLEVEKIKVSDL